MITFDPLWDTLKKKGISQYTLIKENILSTGALDRLRKNGNVTMNTLNELCQRLGCSVEEIIAFVPDVTTDNK